MNRDPVLVTMYGPQRLSRMIQHFRIMARNPTPWEPGSNRRIAHANIRALIREARQVQA